MVCDMKVSEETQRSISALHVAMTSEDAGVSVLGALGQVRMASALSAGTTNNLSAPDRSFFQNHAGDLAGGLPYSSSAAANAPSLCPEPMGTVPPHTARAEAARDCSARKFLDTESVASDSAGHVDRLDHCSCTRRDSTGRFDCNQLCQTCDPEEARRACQELASPSEESSGLPQQNELQLEVKGFSFDASLFTGGFPEGSCLGGNTCHLDSGVRHEVVSCQFGTRGTSPPRLSDWAPGMRSACGGSPPWVVKPCLNVTCDLWVEDRHSSLERRHRKNKPKCPADGPCGSPPPAGTGLKQTGSPQSNGHDGAAEWPAGEFVRNKKERSTLLVRRYYKNNKEVKKSVYTGTRAIVRTLPSGHIGDKVWAAVSRKRYHVCKTLSRSGTERTAELEVVNAWPHRILHCLLRANSGEIHDALRGGEGEGGCGNLLHPSRKLLASAVAGCRAGGCYEIQPCACSVLPHYRATLQRTAVSGHISGALLEATTSIGARSGLPGVVTGSTGRTMLKGDALAVMFSCLDWTFFIRFLDHAP